MRLQRAEVEEVRKMLQPGQTGPVQLPTSRTAIWFRRTVDNDGKDTIFYKYKDQYVPTEEQPQTIAETYWNSGSPTQLAGDPATIPTAWGPPSSLREASILAAHAALNPSVPKIRPSQPPAYGGADFSHYNDYNNYNNEALPPMGQRVPEGYHSFVENTFKQFTANISASHPFDDRDAQRFAPFPAEVVGANANAGASVPTRGLQRVEIEPFASSEAIKAKINALKPGETLVLPGSVEHVPAVIHRNHKNQLIRPPSEWVSFDMRSLFTHQSTRTTSAYAGASVFTPSLQRFEIEPFALSEAGVAKINALKPGKTLVLPGPVEHVPAVIHRNYKNQLIRPPSEWILFDMRSLVTQQPTRSTPREELKFNYFVPNPMCIDLEYLAEIPLMPESGPRVLHTVLGYNQAQRFRLPSGDLITYARTADNQIVLVSTVDGQPL